jgi:hypothetical protein
VSERGPTSRCPSAGEAADDLRPLRGSGPLDGFAELVAEVLGRLTRAGPVTGVSGRTDAQSALSATSDLPVPAHDLLAYVGANWHPIEVPRRGGRKRQRPTRRMNPAGSITKLANAWASETGRSRAQARQCLAVLVDRGLIERDQGRRDRAWRLASSRWRRSTGRMDTRSGDYGGHVP